MLILQKRIIICVIIVGVLLVSSIDARKRKRSSKKAMELRKKETNAVNFIRLAVMRLIYGIATRIGLGEQISEALNGAFVPPGVDDDYSDYGGGSSGGLGALFDRDDYDYR